jgi:hypothetical protein
MYLGMNRLSFLSVALLLMAGCGGSGGSTGGSGGGGGGGNNSTTVTVAFTSGTPTAVATKIGSGSYTTVTPASTVTLTLPSGTTNFGVAYVCPPVTANNEVIDEIIVEASTLDGTSFSLSCSATLSTGATGTLTGSVDASAISGVNSVGIFAENGTSSSSGGPGGLSGSFSFAAPTGTDRVEVLAYDYFNSGQSSGQSHFKTSPGVWSGRHHSSQRV